MKTNLQTVRKSAGYKSAKSFAKSLGISAATYTDYEQGRRAFTLERAWEFADALGCSLDELAGRAWPPEGASDPYEAELVECYRGSTAENRQSLLVAACNSALASGEAAERPLDGTEVDKKAV